MYAFMQAHEQEFSLKRMSQALNVSRSGYYAWKSRPESLRRQENTALVKAIHSIHQESRRTYGSPRIYATLRRKGWVCGHNRVARLMREQRLAGKKPRRFRPTTTRSHAGDRIAPNLLNREFRAASPNRKWVSDITYIGTKEGWLYLAAVVDLYSRRVVGWAMDNTMGDELTQAAWRMAWLQRKPAAGLLHHSDRGSQYTSVQAWEQLGRLHCRVSMSRKGNCYDNAVMESFFSTLKTECALDPFETKREARTKIFEYIETWYNRKRLHSYLGYLSPVEFELQSGH